MTCEGCVFAHLLNSSSAPKGSTKSINTALIPKDGFYEIYENCFYTSSVVVGYFKLHLHYLFPHSVHL